MPSSAPAEAPSQGEVEEALQRMVDGILPDSRGARRGRASERPPRLRLVRRG